MTTTEQGLAELDIAGILSGDVTPLEEDPNVAKAAMVQRILGADTADDLFAPSETVALKDLVGQTLTILNVRLMESDEQYDSPVYVVGDAVTEPDGERITFNTGAGKPLVKLLVCAKNKWFPQRVRVEQSKRATKDGYFPLDLVKA